MKKPVISVRVVGLVALIIAFLFSCQRDNDPLSSQAKAQQSAQTAEENSAMMVAAQDAVNVTGGAFANQGITYGRVADQGDDDDGDDECKPSITNNIKIDRSHMDTLIISGTIKIDFGTGAACDSVHVRKGAIIDSINLVVVFNGKITFKSQESITFQNYWRDSTQVDGNISVSAATGSPTIVKIHGSKIKYHDGTSSSWTGDLVFTAQKDSTGHKTIDVTGSWSGTTRKGVNFSASITKTIVYQAGCFGHSRSYIPVSGSIDVIADGVTSTIDYGTGTCDRMYTITTAGVTTEHRLT